MKEFKSVQDSGGRHEWLTGAIRDIQEGKGRYDLIPFRAINRLAVHFENGAKKYGDDNWRKGIPLRTYLNSALRHTFKFIEGWDDEDHLAAAIWNLMCCLHTEECVLEGSLPAELDDLRSRQTQEAGVSNEPPVIQEAINADMRV